MSPTQQRQTFMKLETKNSTRTTGTAWPSDWGGTRFALTEPWLSEGVLSGNRHHEQACCSLHNFEFKQQQL